MFGGRAGALYRTRDGYSNVSIEHVFGVRILFLALFDDTCPDLFEQIFENSVFVY